ncbi:50S ribosomal protein L23 [Patescibacteria group bacterium]|nr:50S ribosomal protein L23 [Patescibacteria group bacterium]
MTLIIKHPVISEKSIQQGSVSKYAFVVDQRANAHQVKLAVERFFKVKVTKVNMMNVAGKPKRVGRRRVYRANWRKAIVTLAPGQSIKLFEETAKDDSQKA